MRAYWYWPAKISMFIFPTYAALKYIEWVDTHRIKR